MENNFEKIVLPKTQALIDELKKQPTDTERINAVEGAIADLAVMIMGVLGNG